MKKEDYLRPGERFDDLQINNYFIIQHPEKFCFGMDAVLLSYFCSIPKNALVLDLGTGTGILPILLSAKTEAKHFDALEIQEESADMARRSVDYNGLNDRISITAGDIKEASSLFEKGSYDAIVTNPPYMEEKHGLQNPKLPKAIARHEILCNLEDILRESSLLLKPKKSLFIIHRPHRLVEIFDKMRKHGLEPKKMCMVYPYLDKEPNMVMIEAVKDGNPMLKIQPPLIVYDAPGRYSKTILEYYNRSE